jgi:hypothetical protein
MESNTNILALTRPLSQGARYALRDVISLNKLSEFIKARPKMTLGELLHQQEEAAGRIANA